MPLGNRLFARLHRRLFPRENRRKIPVAGGLTVAFIGADGAGKSTIIQHVVKWLSWRINVRTYYMGSAQPSVMTRTLKNISKLLKPVDALCQHLFGDTSLITRSLRTPKRLVDQLRFLAEGRDRYRRYLASRRKAAQGSIIIYDRYPLEAVQILARTVDGPRIASMNSGHLGAMARKLAAIEEDMYQKILPAEHVFVLHVSPDVSQARKPEHNRELIEAKSRAMKHIARDGINLTEIDADQTLDQVLLQIKATLWRLL